MARAAPIVFLAAALVPGCGSCQCGPPSWDAGSWDAGDAAADAGPPPGCPAPPMIVWTIDEAWGADAAGFHLTRNDAAGGVYLTAAIASVDPDVEPIARLIRLDGSDNGPIIPLGSSRWLSWATSFTDDSILVFTKRWSGDGSMWREEAHASRVTPNDIAWDVRVAPLALPNPSGLSGTPARLDDGTIAFTYSYQLDGPFMPTGARAVYDTDGLVAEYEGGPSCTWDASYSGPGGTPCANDGVGGVWGPQIEPGDRFHYHLQHYAVDGAPLIPGLGTEIAPFEPLDGERAVVRHPAGGVYNVYVRMLDPTEPSPSEETSARATFVQRFDASGDLVWSVRADAVDGPKDVDIPSGLHAAGPNGRLVTSWWDARDGGEYEAMRCFVQTFDGGGNALATPGGVEMTGVYREICTWGYPNLALPDEDGILAVWTIGTKHTDMIAWGMRFDWSLVPQWPEPVRLSCETDILPEIISDGARGALIGWSRAGAVFLQRLWADGTVGWDR